MERYLPHKSIVGSIIMIVVPFLYFIVLGFCLFKNEQKLGMGVAATSLLIVISFCAIMIDMNDLYGDYGINQKAYNLFTLILFCIQWTLVILPLHVLSTRKIVGIDSVKEPSLVLFCLLMIGCSAIIILNSLEDLKDALVMDMADVRNQHYQDLGSGTEKGSYLLVLPQILVSIPFPTIALLLFFYMCCFVKGKHVIKIGLFLSSIVQAVLSIIMAGRAAMIYWVFDFFMIFCFTFQYLSAGIKRVIVGASMVVGGLIATGFTIITLSRFDTGDSKNDPFESLYGYAGQHINNFSIMIMNGHNCPITIDREFPFISKTFFHQIYDMVDHYDYISMYCNVTPNVFDTFGGEVYVDLGIVAYIFLLSSFYFLYVFLRDRCQELTFSRVLLVGVFIAFFTHGLFAWPFIGHYASMAIMLIGFLVFYFGVKFKI